MTFSIDSDPSNTEIADAVNYLLANFSNNVSANQNSGQIIGPSGDIVGYLYKYIQVKYSDSFDGSVNFSNTPANRLYYGIRNSDSSTESTNPSDYIWTQVTGGFGTTKYLWYLVSGGRSIQFQIATSKPNPGWVQDGGSAIDLDYTTTAGSTPANFVVIRIPNNSAAPTTAEVLAAIGRNPIEGDLCTVNYNSGVYSLQYKYTSGGWAVFQKYITGDLIVANSIVGNNIAANTITGGNIAANTIAAGNIVSGTITSGQIAAGTITGGNIAALTITGANISAGTISADKLTASYIQVGGAAGDVNSGVTTINGGKITANSITASQIAAATITSTQIASATISAGNMAANSITAANAAIANATVDTLQIAGNAVTLINTYTASYNSNELFWGTHSHTFNIPVSMSKAGDLTLMIFVQSGGTISGTSSGFFGTVGGGSTGLSYASFGGYSGASDLVNILNTIGSFPAGSYTIAAEVFTDYVYNPGWIINVLVLRTFR